MVFNEERLKKMELMNITIRIFSLDFKNYENKDQRKLSKLIFKYETIISNLRKKGCGLDVRDYKIYKRIIEEFNTLRSESFKDGEIKEKLIRTINKLLEPVKELYEKRKLQSNEKQSISSKEKLTCDTCGAIFSRVNKARHLGTKRHLEAQLTPCKLEEQIC